MKKKFLKISKNILILAPVLFVIVFLIIPEIATLTTGAGGGGVPVFGEAIGRITDVIRGVAFGLAVLMIIISAIMFMIAGGDQKRIESAKGMLIFALIGLAVAGAATAIAELVGEPQQ